jgi:hypothetical protein
VKVETQVSDLGDLEDVDSEELPGVTPAVLVPEGKVEPTEASLHSAVLENLERMQSDLAALVSKWTRFAPGEFNKPEE